MSELEEQIIKYLTNNGKRKSLEIQNATGAETLELLSAIKNLHSKNIVKYSIDLENIDYQKAKEIEFFL